VAYKHLVQTLRFTGIVCQESNLPSCRDQPVKTGDNPCRLRVRLLRESCLSRSNTKLIAICRIPIPPNTRNLPASTFAGSPPQGTLGTSPTAGFNVRPILYSYPSRILIPSTDPLRHRRINITPRRRQLPPARPTTFARPSTDTSTDGVLACCFPG
jgi:hypothetical protein